MSIFLESAAAISMQEPLTNQWFRQPVFTTNAYNESIEPDYKPYISPLEARRMGRLLKRAVATSLAALRTAECENVDAIITGTGLGCVENTEKFLLAMLENNEECLPPTAFMQSTHNTISSQVALKLKCHGYNCTYSHQGLSFDSALFDALLQFELGKIKTVLVEGHDEMTPSYFTMLGKLGYWKRGVCDTEALRNSHSEGSISGNASVAFLLSDTKKQHTMCEIKEMRLLYRPSEEKMNDEIERCLAKANLSVNEIDALVLGFNGDKNDDAVFRLFAQKHFPGKTIAWYKHLFGESFCASAFGLMTGAEILYRNRIPEHLLYQQGENKKDIHNILIYNHFNNKDHSIILLGR